MGEQVAVRELNQDTSAVLRRVAAGATLTVTSGGRPVARLVPIAAAESALERLVTTGHASAPTMAGPPPMPPRYGRSRVNVADALSADRDEERW